MPCLRLWVKKCPAVHLTNSLIDRKHSLFGRSPATSVCKIIKMNNQINKVMPFPERSGRSIRWTFSIHPVYIQAITHTKCVLNFVVEFQVRISCSLSRKRAFFLTAFAPNQCSWSKIGHTQQSSSLRRSRFFFPANFSSSSKINCSNRPKLLDACR